MPGTKKRFVSIPSSLLVSLEYPTRVSVGAGLNAVLEALLLVLLAAAARAEVSDGAVVGQPRGRPFRIEQHVAGRIAY
jgi:hypothetical protein